MAATKFIDAIARLPDYDGENFDAMCAYTQVKLHVVQRLLAKGCQLIEKTAQVKLLRVLQEGSFLLENSRFGSSAGYPEISGCLSRREEASCYKE